MKDTKKAEQLDPIAQRAWKRLESEFPLWREHLDIRDAELEFAVPAPNGSRAGHLIAFSCQGSLWVRFSPPYTCYGADDEDELVSVIQQLITDQIVFKVTMKGNDWVETTLARPQEESESLPGESVRFTSWSGKLDR